MDQKPKKFSTTSENYLSATDNVQKYTNPAMNYNAGDVKSTPNFDHFNVTLHQVAREGDVRLMKKVLERFSNQQQIRKKVNTKDNRKWTPLHYAARYNHFPMMYLLIENEADVQMAGEDNTTTLHYLAKHKKKTEISEASNQEMKSAIKWLVSCGANVNAQDAMGLTPLHHACAKNNIIAIRSLLEISNILLEAPDNQGLTALHNSCASGQLEVIEMLLEAGAQLKCRDKNMATPFHYTCTEGNIEIAKLLLNKAKVIGHRNSISRDTEFSIVTETNQNGKKRSHQSFSELKDMYFKRHKSSGCTGVIGLKSNSSESGNDSNNSLRGAIDLIQDVDAEKNLPFHLAISNGHLEMVKLCMEQGKQAGWGEMIHANRSNGDSCLHLAVQSNSVEVVEYLLDHGIFIDVRNAKLETPLMHCCQRNHDRILKFLLQKKADAESKNSDDITPLMMACRYGHYESIYLLLEHGVDIKEEDKEEKTCLMYAAEENKTEAISLLLDHCPVDELLEERDKYNNTALHLASMKGHEETVKLLLEHDASTDIRNDDDRTTLHMAALHGRDVVIEDLIRIDHGILNSCDEESNTALHLAAIGGNLKSVSVLLRSGASMEIRNGRKRTALDCAAAHGYEKIVSKLLEAGASLTPSGKIMITPLHLACKRGHVNVVKILLKWKADVTFKSAEGKNALDFAIDFGQKDCVLELITHKTWRQSMTNSIIDPVTGQMVTPMRKLIMKMEDMAIVVCNQCITDNGKKPENDDYEVTLSFDFLDDMYSSTVWLDHQKENTSSSNNTDAREDYNYAVYDENDKLTPEARTYTPDTQTLHMNHPLQTMVRYESENLLLHPVVTCLLSHKWRLFGRYVYYINLLLYLVFLILLTSYMMLHPPFYSLNWSKIIYFRRYIDNNRNATGLDIPPNLLATFANDSLACYYYRQEVTEDPHYIGQHTPDCYVLPTPLIEMKWAILTFATYKLLLQVLRILHRRSLKFGFSNFVEITMYIFCILVVIDYPVFKLNRVTLLTASRNFNDVVFIHNFQLDTGLRQEWQEQVGAFAMFLSWMVLLLYIRKFPRLGIYVVMFTDILKTFSEFFIVFFLFIMAFALAFTVLLGNQHQFSTWYESVIKTTVMMAGGLDYAEIFYSAPDTIAKIGLNYHTQIYPREVSRILAVIFVIVMTIILVNLLVGLAVGDIMSVQEQATLKRLGMQVDLALEVEFTLPAFLRKKTCKRKQRIQIHKYRSSNFFTRLLMQDTSLSMSDLSSVLQNDKEEDDSSSSDDKVMNGINNLRGRMSDMLSDQADLKESTRELRALLRKSQLDSIEQTDKLKEKIEVVNDSMSTRIASTGTGLMKTTRIESLQTRDRVEGTHAVVKFLKEDLEVTKQGMHVMKQELQSQIKILHEEVRSRNWDEMETRVDDCRHQVEETRKEIMESLQAVMALIVESKKDEKEENEEEQQQPSSHHVHDEIAFFEQVKNS